MTIWIDITDLSSWRGHFTGIQRVVFNVASRLQRDEDNVKFFYYEPRSRAFHEKEINLFEWLASNSNTVGGNKSSFKNKMIDIIPYKVHRMVPQKIKKGIKKTGRYVLSKKNSFSFSVKSTNNDKHVGFADNDIVMVLGNGWDNQNILGDLGKLKQAKKFKLVNVVYDLIPIFEPQFFGGLVTAQYANYMFEAVTNCDLLLPISKSTETDITRFCEMIDAARPMTKVIRLGDEISDNNAPSRPQWLRDEKFVLCVGTLEIRKNHTLLYYTYKSLINDGFIPPKLIIVGKVGWYVKDTLMLFEQDISVRDYIQVVQNTTDEELAWLYENCLYTVYPSFYEGWGLPVAESLARGKVVLSTNSSSVPEAGGDLADYFSPYNPIELSNLIKKYSNEKDLKVKESKISKDYKITKWEDTYRQVKQYVLEILSK